MLCFSMEEITVTSNVQGSLTGLVCFRTQFVPSLLSRQDFPLLEKVGGVAIRLT